MNRLTVQLVVAFVFVSVITLGIVLFILQSSLTDRFGSYVVEKDRPVVESLARQLSERSQMEGRLFVNRNQLMMETIRRSIDMTGNRVRYSKEQKEAIVKRMMPPNNESVKQIAKEENITEVTLYKWRKEARAAGVATPGNGQTSNKWNSQDKFLIVMETLLHLTLFQYSLTSLLVSHLIEPCLY
jgi:transposase-like protein